ncbi:sialate O-acetylesterase [Pricia antarctica]|uniref:Sialate O-acetylesterase n=1 Tax=Pricia antarctica TaxID=641691 RepID=A0A1G7HH34_9FLAO|nr:sialate O-acetylesterase [Pricia antarctica]SDE99671.1 sialate O-acetylesterase [Pricia antarctica]
MKKLLFILLFIPNLFFAQSALRLPDILSDHMLLQQDSEVKFWGWANPRSKIQIITDWNSDTLRTTASNKAKWEALLKTPKAGGPFSIQVLTEEERITIEDVMIGELWICSGQSNMEYNADKGIIDAKTALPDSKNDQIRFFFVEKATADYPQDELTGHWEICGPESMRKFSSVGYFFGRKLNEELNIPVGLINSNWGGTPVETWIPNDEIKDLEKVQAEVQNLNDSEGWDRDIATTYNAMIHPLTKMRIAGTIWYQGESNTPNANSYSTLFTTMIEGWRAKFQNEFPFYYVQIAPFQGYSIPFSAAIVREQQQKASSFEKSGMVVISDLVDDVDDIHPKYKKEVGNRLANWALAETYAKETPKYTFATVKEQKINGAKIQVSFDNVGEGLVVKRKRIEALEIAGADKKFYPADGKIDKDTSTLIVTSKKVKNPRFVRYMFGNGSIGNLFDESGLPVAPFRTDEIVYDVSENP